MSNDEVSREVLRLLQAGRMDRDTAKSLLMAIRAQSRQEAAARPGPEKVAIIGAALQLPGARDLGSLWRVFNRETDMIGELPDERRGLCRPYLDREGERNEVDPGRPFMSGAWITDIDKFDAPFFGMTPAEAEATDPQQRRFLQVAYECLERAGYAGASLRGSRTGVYVAVASTDYMDAMPEVSPVAVPGNVPSFVASRLSYLYDLRGPSYVVSSTCASSLLALHDALNGLALGDCDMALVGGVNIFPYPVRAARWVMNASGIMAEDERCRPFSDDAEGIGRGEGVAAILLKPLAAARRDKDNVLATILSSAANNDGASAAITAPSPAAHSRLLVEAWRRAGVDPGGLDYLEAHGTGTKLGDPIEIKGITDAVRRYTDSRQFLPVGSVKGHFGHLLDGMAGLSGLLRALLVLRHGAVPPTANLSEPNRHIDFLASPVFVPTERWPLARPAGRPLRAGVSCFGFNGTNVHVVLEAEPARPRKPEAAGRWPFPLSARSTHDLVRLIRRWSTFDPGTPGASGALAAADVAYTLWAGREHFAERVVIEAAGLGEFRDRCRALSQLPSARWGEVPGVAVRPGAGLPPDSPVAIYLAGGDPDTAKLFADHDVRREELPVYPFDELSYWVGEPAGTEGAITGEPPESAIARLVGETLKIGRPDVDSSFISLGGTSLSALQLTARLRRELGAAVGVEDVLAARSLRELAARADMAAARPAEPSAGRSAPAAMSAVVMSSVQRRFWFLEQMHGESGHYNLPLMLWLTGPLDVGALAAALTGVERRHTVLRYRYPAGESGMPAVEPGAPPIVLGRENVSGPDAAARRAAAIEAARIATARPFDLANGPAWRATLIEAGSGEHLLAVTMHHIVSDIWSLTLLDSELRALYNAAASGSPPGLGPLETDYAQWARWEREELSGDRLRELEGYWRRTLSGFPRQLELPADRPRVSDAPAVGGHLTFAIEPRIAALISQTCASRQATPFMVLFTALAALSWRLSGTSDIVIGTEHANRTAPGADALIGSFVNQIPVRVLVGEEATFGGLLEQVRSAALGAFAHATLPFDRVSAVSGHRRQSGNTPLFGVKLLFSDLSWHEEPMSGLTTEHVDTESAASPFDFTVRVFRESDQNTEIFTGSVSYRPDLFDPATADRYVRQFQDFLDWGFTDPSRPVREFTLDSPGGGTRHTFGHARSGTSAGIAGRRRPVMASLELPAR